MSSLMQHHGGRSRDGRKVELLMYLTERYEQKPLSCSHCGHHWNNERLCAGCGRFVLFVWEYSPEYSPHHNSTTGEGKTELLTMEETSTFPEYELCCRHDSKRIETTTVSNWWKSRDTEPVELTRPDGSTTTCAKLYRIFRRPVGMWGCWVVFRYNGAEHVPDLSVPIGVEKLPRGAKPLTNEEAAQYWFTP